MKKTLSGEQQSQILRLRKIRENLGVSQEKFAEILEISISAYKKIEAYENQISLSVLKKLHNKLNISVDYILFGEQKTAEKIWDELLNSSETDKLFIFLKLFYYFSYCQSPVYLTEDKQMENSEKIFKLIQELQRGDEKDET